MNERLLHRLVERQAITDILIEYCTALDRMDLGRLASLFTADCVAEYGPEEWLRSRGREALEQSLARMWRWSRTSHHLSNVQVDFRGDDEAFVRSYVHAWHESGDGSSATILGQYHDRFVRGDEGWRIAERRMVMNGSDAGFKVNNQPLRAAPPASGLAAAGGPREGDRASSDLPEGPRIGTFASTTARNAGQSVHGKRYPGDDIHRRM